MKDLKKEEDKYIKLDFDTQVDSKLLEEYYKKIEEGLNDVKYNRIISREDLLKEIQDWDSE
ncbi:hypothetical protein [Flavobacterium hercynium]|uniref:Uncharacterized protein n=1 Tax=Flavobacterium hercynium TaxID=387094 RepID=A0A226HL65_9FLAO|nr:hypothetical protein [Flavobacterium hercynium]OXA94854.1 hypothetical protein B0A66_03760 [Flavobacterium hercynium]SMP08626.1 hypothetical protein SAMN06265346_102182 [Flavobacterium hercynium]